MIPKYPQVELPVKKKIDDLNDRWFAHIKDFDMGLSSLYVRDGFYPYYTLQRLKILFIGRECLGLSGCDYINELYAAIKLGKVGGKSLDNYKFHALMLRIAYGLQHDFPDYQDIPTPTELSKSFATSEGVSYAFMNLSKLSNESGIWKSDKALIDKFLSNSIMPQENYFAREIEILNPDLIISMNLNENEKIDRHRFIGVLKCPAYFGNNGQICAQKLVTRYGEYDFIDSFHFSAPNKKCEEDYYLPIVAAVKDILAKKS